MMPYGPPAKATAEFGLHVIASHAVPYGAAHAVELSQNGTRVLAGAAFGLM